LSKTRDALRYPVYLPRVWGRGTKSKPLPEPHLGLDTERDSKNGKFVCGWVSNNLDSKPFTTFSDLSPATYWIWNLGYDIEGLIRDLGAEEGWAMREDGTRFELGEASCVYYHGKRFEWKDNVGKRIFLEASSFFNRIPLKEALKALCVCSCDGCKKHKKQPLDYQHCGKDYELCPTKDPVNAAKMSWSQYQKDNVYRALVNDYCAKDARGVWRLVNFLRLGFKELDIEIGGTPGATAKRFMANIPQFPKVIWQTHRKFLSAYCGGMFQINRRGVFHRARQYDKISAYPWALSLCPMLTESAYQQFSRTVSVDAHYGAYEVSFDSDEYFGIMPTWKGSTRVYSKGEERGWMTKPELDFLQDRGIDYKILAGVEVFDDNATNGWEELVIPMFLKKEGHTKECKIFLKENCDCNRKLKGQPMSLGSKVGVNSLYGDLIQLILKGGVWLPIEQAKNPVDFAGTLALEKGPKAFDAGQFYAPLYSASLTAMVRIDLLKEALRIGAEKVVAFHTDSILTFGDAKMNVGDKLGDWSLEKEADELIILKSGQYSIGGTVKGRGFSKRKLNPDNEEEIAQRHKQDLWAESQMRRGRIGIKTATNWQDVSLIREKTVANNISWELKRKWLGGFGVREIRRMIDRNEFEDSEALGNLNSGEK